MEGALNICEIMECLFPKFQDMCAESTDCPAHKTPWTPKPEDPLRHVLLAIPMTLEEYTTKLDQFLEFMHSS
jgi:hypothetical protein